MNEPLVIDPRRRIRELLAIPERDRTDEQWDELNELEIRTAPGNREIDRQQPGAPEGRQNFAVQGRRSNKNPRPDLRLDVRPDARPQEARADGRPPKRQHRRPKRPIETPGNS